MLDTSLLPTAHRHVRAHASLGKIQRLQLQVIHICAACLYLWEDTCSSPRKAGLFRYLEYISETFSVHSHFSAYREHINTFADMKLTFFLVLLCLVLALVSADPDPKFKKFRKGRRYPVYRPVYHPVYRPIPVPVYQPVYQPVYVHVPVAKKVISKGYGGYGYGR
ncbi:hypothetical protein FHG87_003394 [Trinorchestia longiramus]|nr:hypothetical protein FHG87_003394 [Trinorchestia longiramus]